MQPQATKRLYLDDDHCFEAEAKVVSIRENAIAFDQTCF
jgi:Ser-tRNA(Ala) deacylase AlaX